FLTRQTERRARGARPRAMLIGFHVMIRAPVPKGKSTIAQRFNAGWRELAGRVPKGRLNSGSVSRPFGTYDFPTVPPSVETLGYFHSSLRDENPQILVASPVLGRSSRRRGPAQENYPGIRLIGARCARGRAHSVQALLHWIVLFLLLTPPTHLIAQEIESG